MTAFVASGCQGDAGSAWHHRAPFPPHGGVFTSMDPLVRRVCSTIRQRALIDAGDRVAVAVSGGADSVALARLLVEASSGAGWCVAGILHVHHGLRAGEADADEASVRRLAAELALPVDVSRVDVRAAVAATHRSIEAAARELRYDALAAAAARLGATRVATGHTADDQAETVLLRLLRGSSARGLGGVRISRGMYIRPLLGCRRTELRRYLSTLGQTFRDDASNMDLSVTRNRLRHRLMPAVETDWPGGVDALARFADLAAADEEYLTGAAKALAIVAVRSHDGGVQVNMEPLGHQHLALVRRVIRDAIETAGGVPSFQDVEAVRALLERKGRSVVLRALVARADHDSVWLSRQVARRDREIGNIEYGLTVPGSVDLPQTCAVIRASLLTGDRVLQFETLSPPITGSQPDRVMLQQTALVLPLTVRTRRPGDRFRPLGAPGTRKVQDVMVDRKVPRAERDKVPIVVDAEGRIVWVAGVAMAHDCRVTEPEGGMVILELMRTDHQ
jgi:tRNA(Ile)-lysidine synthase